MPKYSASLSNSGPYNVPTGSNIVGASKYGRVITAAATFYATASNGGVVAVSSTAGCTVTLTGGGSLVIPANTTTPIEISVSTVTAGTAFLFYRY